MFGERTRWTWPRHSKTGNPSSNPTAVSGSAHTMPSSKTSRRSKRSGAGWTSPALQLPGMEVEFPVERGALATIFANLLRNAQAAARDGGEQRVLVRLGEERDAAGRRLVTLLVGDSSPRELTLEAIEQRESGRGLAIVRDLTREWHGHLIVRAEGGPWTKSVGACFPASSA